MSLEENLTKVLKNAIIEAYTEMGLYAEEAVTQPALKEPEEKPKATRKRKAATPKAAKVEEPVAAEPETDQADEASDEMSAEDFLAAVKVASDGDVIAAKGLLKKEMKVGKFADLPATKYQEFLDILAAQ